MGNSGWRTQISFLLAGAIFVLCHMIVSGARDNVEEAGLSQTRDRSLQAGARSLVSANRFETEGRSRRAD
jgi:hypothetical protein